MPNARELRLVSWNVNGLRAVMKKDPSFTQVVEDTAADVFAIQETKLQAGQIELDLPGYHQTWSYAERKGYSGTAVFSREEPLRVLRADALLPIAHEVLSAEDEELVAVAATEGRVCARPVTPYPPGVPLLWPGEKITKAHVELIRERWYNDIDRITVVMPEK